MKLISPVVKYKNDLLSVTEDAAIDSDGMVRNAKSSGAAVRHLDGLALPQEPGNEYALWRADCAARGWLEAAHVLNTCRSMNRNRRYEHHETHLIS